MTESTLGERALCAALMAAVGWVLVWRPRARWTPVALAILALAGLVNGLALNLQRPNLLGNNLVHYYLGAKHPIPYARFYEAFQAARGEPAVGIRDLEHPDRLLRASVPEQRAYFIDLLRSAGASFDALAPTDSLVRWARASGALARASERVMGECLPAARISDYREDVRVVAANTVGRPLTDDFGFNGSPFYALIRRLDPTLHVRFGPVVGWVNLAWQTLAVVALAWIAGAALALEVRYRLAICALIFASYDFVAFAMPGLVFGELWLPVAVAALAMRRRRAALAGIAIAWAGLVKLFPFILLLPALSRLVPRRPGERAAFAWSVRLLATGALAALVLGGIAVLSGRSWVEFFDKVIRQFEGAALAMNSVGRNAGLQVLGLHDSPATTVLSILALGFLATMFVGDRDEEFFAALPRRALVLVAATGWVAHSWLNYYVVLPYVLVPAYLREHRGVAGAAVFAMAASFLLPDFTDPVLIRQPALHFLKLLPYLAVPLGMVVIELAPRLRTRTVRVAAASAAAIMVLVAGVETWRVRTVDRLTSEAIRRLDADGAAAALERYDRLLRLAPRDARGHMNRGIALAMLGRMGAAHDAFQRAARLAPDYAAAQDNYGRILLAAGNTEAAAIQLEKARALAPDDPQVLVVLAGIRQAQGRTAEATNLFTRARELDPGNPAIVEGGGTPPP